MDHSHSFHYNSPTGWLEIKTTAQYLQAISWTEPPQEMTAAADSLQKIIADQLDAYFNGELQLFDLPLMLRGTEFQTKIWQLLQEIPWGQTISYMELAQRLGDVKAIRAVGMANNKNPIPIVVPCHRVIGSDGRLVGFASGIDRKEWLLHHEGALPQMSLFYGN